MNAEYQRLKVEATECWQQLTAQGRVGNRLFGSGSDAA